MKKNLVLFTGFVLLLLSTMLSSCSKEQTVAKQNSVVLEQPVYKLYPTQNLWIFIKLNTVNGKMWYVQYSVENTDSRIEIPLNEQSLLQQEQTEVVGRFSLVETKNMWNFILLDQVDGKQWQVQWSTDGENNLLLPILPPKVEGE